MAESNQVMTYELKQHTENTPHKTKLILQKHKASTTY